MHQCLFIICVIVYNLYDCYYAKTSSPAVQIRHSKVYGNPIAPSFYSTLFGVDYEYISLVVCMHTFKNLKHYSFMLGDIKTILYT